MGYGYVIGVVSAGLLAVLLLALLTEQVRRRTLEQALAKVPGFRPSRSLCIPRAVIAVDDRSRILCVGALGSRALQVDVVPFDRVLGSEITRNGVRVTRAARLHADRAAAVSPGSDVRPAPAPGAEQIALRFAVDGRPARVRELPMPGMREAVRWHMMLKGILESVAQDQRRAGEPAPRPAPAPQRPQGEADPEQAVRQALDALLEARLRHEQQIVVPERALRDECGVDLPIIRFHEYMNRIKRHRRLHNMALSYSRRDETWRIRRKAS